jgi:hypothetical protein
MSNFCCPPAELGDYLVYLCDDLPLSSMVKCDGPGQIGERWKERGIAPGDIPFEVEPMAANKSIGRPGVPGGVRNPWIIKIF